MSDFCDAMDCNLPGSSVHGILQARILEWVAISFPRDLLDSGIEPRSPALQVDSVSTELWGKPHPFLTPINFPSPIHLFLPIRTLCPSHLERYFPILCHRGLVLWKTIFQWAREWRMVSGWFKCITFTVFFFPIIITSVHLRSSGIRSWRLGTPDLVLFVVPPNMYHAVHS